MSKKESYYFPHYIGARNDRKIKRVRKDFGVEGYALFFMTLERLREEESLKIPVEDIDLLADDFGTSEAKLHTLIHNYKLFDFEESANGRIFFSPKQIQYLEPYFEMREQRRLAGIASGKARKRKAKEKIEKEQLLLNECSNTCSTDAELIKKEVNKEEKEKKENGIKIGKITPEIYTQLIRPNNKDTCQRLTRELRSEEEIINILNNTQHAYHRYVIETLGLSKGLSNG